MHIPARNSSLLSWRFFPDVDRGLLFTPFKVFDALEFDDLDLDTTEFTTVSLILTKPFDMLYLVNKKSSQFKVCIHMLDNNGKFKLSIIFLLKKFLW